MSGTSHALCVVCSNFHLVNQYQATVTFSYKCSGLSEAGRVSRVILGYKTFEMPVQASGQIIVVIFPDCLKQMGERQICASGLLFHLDCLKQTGVIFYFALMQLHLLVFCLDFNVLFFVMTD